MKIPRKVRLAVIERDQSCCRCLRPGTDIHHRTPRGMGGTRDPAINRMAALVLLCRTCHAWAESNRATAFEQGWLVPRGCNPELVPVWRQGAWWQLTDNDFQPTDNRKPF